MYEMKIKSLRNTKIIDTNTTKKDSSNWAHVLCEKKGSLQAAYWICSCQALSLGTDYYIGKEEEMGQYWSLFRTHCNLRPVLKSFAYNIII